MATPGAASADAAVVAVAAAAAEENTSLALFLLLLLLLPLSRLFLRVCSQPRQTAAAAARTCCRFVAPSIADTVRSKCVNVAGPSV